MRPVCRLLPPLAAFALLSLGAAPARAHLSGVSQVRMDVGGHDVRGEWELHLHDARLAIGLEPNLAGDSGFVNLRDHEDELRRVLLSKLALETHGRPLAIRFIARRMEWKPEPHTVQLAFEGRADSTIRRLRIAYSLLFDVDQSHRGFFTVRDGRNTHLGTFKSYGEKWIEIDVKAFNPGQTIGDFAREGVHPIASGFDHVLFLLALLLPAPLVRAARTWTPRPGFWATAFETVKVVTAFTLAHSTTLGLSFFGVVNLPSRWVESAIAASVFLAAWNNLHPFLPGRAWALALGFGLVHGLGFASALGGLAVPPHARALALGAFNGGVELGQLAIVGVVLPVLFFASRRGFYPKLVMGVGSFAIGWLAMLWFVERAFDVSLLG